MRRALVIGLAAALVGGCSSSPCDGRGASCVTALVQGYAGTLDQLRISIDQPTAATSTTPSPPSSFTLPVKVALVLPVGTAGNVSVGIEGLSGGAVVASAPAQTVIVPTKSTVTFTLAGSNGEPDMTAPPFDLSGATGVAILPASFNFSIDRNSNDSKVFQFYNNTTAPVTATAALSGDAVFTISNDGCAGAAVDPGSSCAVTVLFQPTATASGKATMLTIGGASASITGDAKPIWVKELPPTTNMPVRAIVADAGHYYVVASLAGSGQNSQVWVSTGDGQWTATNPAFGSMDVLTSVARSGTTSFAGGGAGVWLSNSAPWMQQPVPSSDGGSGVAGLYMNADAGFSVGPAGIFTFANAAWKMSGPGAGDAGAANLNAITSDGNHALFAVGNNSIGYAGDTSGTWGVALSLNGGASPPTTLRGVWMPIGGVPGKVWAVGDPTAAAPNGTIYVVDRATSTASLESTSALPAGSILNGIHGSVAGGTTRIYAVGSTPAGGVVATSSGNGTWTTVTVPVSVPFHAVWVSDAVDVFVVGDSGTILHYY